MPGRWVFRRPPRIARRRFVPHGVAAATAGHVVVRWRRAWRARRRTVARRRPVVVDTSSARGQAPVLRRRLPRILRRVQRARARFPALGFTAQATSHTVVLRRRAPKRRPAPPRRARPQVQSFQEPQAVIPSIPVLGRLMRAVGRIRRAAQRRLFWRPPPEILPAVERVVAAPKGRIFSPGMIRGRVYHPGD